MASKGGVIVTIDGVDRTGEVFASIKKHNEELKISAKETSESLGQIGESLKHGLEAAGIAVGVKELISQLHEAVTEATEFGESIAKAGERTGIAAGTLSVLHYAAAVTSTDFDKLVTASGKMGKNLADAADGNKKLEAAFQKIGVTARDVVGRHDALDIVIQHLGKTLAETESPARRLQVAGDLLGKSGQAQIPVLINLAENFDELKKKAQAAGVYLGDMSANQLQELNAKMKDLEQRVLGAKVAFAEGLSPALTGIASAFADATRGQDIWAASGKTAGLLALGMAGAFNQITEATRGLADDLIILNATGNWLQSGADMYLDIGKDARARAYNKHEEARAELHDAQMDHAAAYNEEKAFNDKILALQKQIENPAAQTAKESGSTGVVSASGSSGGGTGGGGGRGRVKKTSDPFTVDTEALDEQDLIQKDNMQRAVAALNKADADAAAAWDKMIADADAEQAKTLAEVFKDHTPVRLAPDYSAIDNEAEKFAHGLFDPLFNFGEKWDKQWKQIRANMLRDLGQTAESQLFGQLFGDSSGRGGRGWDGSGGDGKSGHNGLLNDGIGKAGDLLGNLFHKKPNSVSNGTGAAGAGTVLSAAASTMQIGKSGAGGSGIQVILNNNGSPLQVDQTQQSGGDGGEGQVIQIILKQLETNGPVSQGIMGLFSH